MQIETQNISEIEFNDRKRKMWNKAKMQIELINKSELAFKIEKAYVFGSFSTKSKPKDIDVLAFINQNTSFARFKSTTHFIFVPFKESEFKLLYHFVKRSLERYEGFKLLCLFDSGKQLKRD